MGVVEGGLNEGGSRTLKMLDLRLTMVKGK